MRQTGRQADRRAGRQTNAKGANKGRLRLVRHGVANWQLATRRNLQARAAAQVNDPTAPPRRAAAIELIDQKHLEPRVGRLQRCARSRAPEADHYGVCQQRDRAGRLSRSRCVRIEAGRRGLEHELSHARNATLDLAALLRASHVCDRSRPAQS